MKYFFTLAFIFITVVGFSQIEDPVQWDYQAIKKADQTYQVVITATLQKPWHIYSSTTPAGGPVPTKISYKTNPLITVGEKLQEKGTLQTIHDQNFGVDVKYYSNKVAFTQTVKTKGAVKTNLSGTVEYMVCNDEKCLPPTKKSFEVKLQ